MAAYDIVRCGMNLPPHVAGVTEWRTRDFGWGFQTFEIDADGALRLFRLERRLRDGHPPRPALLDPGYTDWLQTWTTFERSEPILVAYTGGLTLEGRDREGAEWMIHTSIDAGHCRPFRISRTRAEESARAA